MNAYEWATLTGEFYAIDRVGGLVVDQVGMGPASEDVVAFDGQMNQLDRDIQTFEFVPGPATTADEFAHMAAMIVSLRLRWGNFFPTWRAWRDVHEQSFTRLSGASGIEFGEFEVQYNAFRRELADLGGKVTAPEIQTTPSPGTPSGVDKVLDFLSSIKWILAIGVVGYVLVGTGAVPAIAAAFAGKRAA